jgi:glucose repression regulatory protein TUP1
VPLYYHYNHVLTTLPVAHQLQELTHLRNSIYELEGKHAKLRQGYEDDLARLRAELAQAARAAPPPPPPGPGGAYGDAFYAPRRERERAPDRERPAERDILDRKMKAERSKPERGGPRALFRMRQTLTRAQTRTTARRSLRDP